MHRKRLNSRWNIDSTLATNVRSYTYKELEEATRGFRQTVGKGAFRTVYKGVLPSDSTRYVAVKKLGKVVEKGENEFKTEVSVIGQTHHKNLVRLLGQQKLCKSKISNPWCKVLVQEYVLRLYVTMDDLGVALFV